MLRLHPSLALAAATIAAAGALVAMTRAPLASQPAVIALAGLGLLTMAWLFRFGWRLLDMEKYRPRPPQDPRAGTLVRPMTEAGLLVIGVALVAAIAASAVSLAWG
jgi:hypothetical protein